MITQEQAKEILGVLSKGNDYAELFLERTSNKGYSNFNNVRFTPSIQRGGGTGIRVWKGEEVTFLSLDSIEFEDILKEVKTIEKEGTQKEISFSNVDGEFKNDDFTNYGPEEVKKILEATVKQIKEYSPLINTASSHVSSTLNDRLIATSDGSFIKKTTIQAALGYSATSSKGETRESAYGQISKQISFAGLLKSFDTKENKDKITHCAKIAVELLDAPRIKSGEMPVILPSGFGGVLFHEAVGHPLEATQVARGKSLFNDKVGKKVATDIVTLIDDGTIEGERGSSSYDDDGVKNERRVLIEKGVLKDFLVDKYNGEVLMKRKSNGAGRRQSFRYASTSRMSNTFVENGTSTVEEIIKATKNGFYAKQLGGGQVDPFSGKFNFGVTEGYLIEDGEIKHLVKNATLIGNGIEALMKIDMIANDLELGPGTCGSSSGMIPVTVGQPTLRITDMIVGGGNE